MSFPFSQLLYSFISTCHHHHPCLSLLSKLTCKQRSLCFEGTHNWFKRKTPLLLSLFVRFEDCVFLRFSEVGGAGADMWKIHPVVCGHAFNTCIHCTWTSIMFWHYEGIVAFCLVFILTIKEKENCFVFPGYDYLLQNLIYPDAQAWTLNLSIISKLWGCKNVRGFVVRWACVGEGGMWG